MIDRTASACRCIGFAAFTNRRNRQSIGGSIRFAMTSSRWRFSGNSSKAVLVRIQHSMIDLLKFLDTEIREPSRIAAAAGADIKNGRRARWQ
jgi:hypothetical protein